MAETYRTGYPYARLRQVGAVQKPDRSSSTMHVYYSGMLRRWISVVQTRPGVFELEFHNACPCSGGG